jgi:signal transduction histidine kinase
LAWVNASPISYASIIRDRLSIMPQRFLHRFQSFKPTDISHVFRLIEWMAIGIVTLTLLFDQPWREWEARMILPRASVYFILAGIFVLSFAFPTKRPLWQRRAYVAIVAGLIVGASLAGYSLDILLYLLIAKSCFLLSRRDLVVLLLGAGVAWNAAQMRIFYQSFDFISKVPPDINYDRLLITSTLTSFGVYITACTFVLLLSLTIVREQCSRARAEQLTQEIESLAATVERSRIAREIHDSLGHTLTALNVQIELAQKLQQRDPDRSRQSIDIAQQLAIQCLQDVRHAVHSMHDRTIDLNTAIQTLIQPLCSDPDVQMTAILKFPALSPTTSHQIYCIIQEGLTNIQRHAQATQVQLQGELVQDQILVILRDNGVGFNLDQASTGFGLHSMTDRAASFGGQLTIDSAPQQGTRIQLECYLTP